MNKLDKQIKLTEEVILEEAYNYQWIEQETKLVFINQLIIMKTLKIILGKLNNK